MVALGKDDFGFGDGAVLAFENFAACFVVEVFEAAAAVLGCLFLLLVVVFFPFLRLGRGLFAEGVFDHPAYGPDDEEYDDDDEVEIDVFHGGIGNEEL